MLLALFLFDAEFVNIVSISFTALILNELIMVALSINTWHRYMLYAELISLAIYFTSILVLKQDFDLRFILTFAFAWKVVAITAVASLPLYLARLLARAYNPPSYTKL
ncbi:putative aminophospholipid-translocase [Massospora cicadina]|nr:putative aminophospholipid-translocase [Massospora cicadina]